MATQRTSTGCHYVTPSLVNDCTVGITLGGIMTMACPLGCTGIQGLRMLGRAGKAPAGRASGAANRFAMLACRNDRPHRSIMT